MAEAFVLKMIPVHVDGLTAYALGREGLQTFPAGQVSLRGPVCWLTAEGRVPELVGAQDQVRPVGLIGAAGLTRPGAFIFLGEEVDGAVSPGLSGGQPVRLAHLTVPADCSCPCGGRRHLAGLWALSSLKRRFGSEESLASLWENREESGLAPIWGEAMTGLACAIASLASLFGVQSVVLGGPVGELPDFCLEVGDWVYPLLGRPQRPGPAIEPWGGEEEFLMNARRAV